MIGKFIRRLMLLVALGMVGWIGYQGYQTRSQWPGGIDPAELPQNNKEPALRVAVGHRPSELPLRALKRFPELSRLKLEFRDLEDPADRFRLLAAGQVDVVVASVEELALAIPRFNPGVVVFPVAISRGAQGLVEVDRTREGGPYLVGYPPDGTSAYLAEYLARTQTAQSARSVEARDVKQLMDWLKTGQVQAGALWEPYLSQALAQGAKLSANGPRTPVQDVWVVSRAALEGTAAPRVTGEDVELLAQAWFNLVDQLKSDPRLILSAIAEENSMTTEQLQVVLKGIEFLTLSDLQDQGREALTAQLLGRLNQALTSWALFGTPNRRDPQYESALNLEMLDRLRSESAPGASPAPSESETPSIPEESPAESPAATPEEPDDEAGSSQGHMLGYSLGRSGMFPTPALASFNQVAWRFGTEGEVNSGISLDENFLYFGSDDGYVYSIDKVGANLRWRFQAQDKVRSTPAVAEGKVFVGCHDGRLYALKQESGEKLWVFQTDAEVVASPLVWQSRVYGASMDGQVFCLEADTGNPVWTRKLGAFRGSPALADGVIYIGSLDKNVYALDAETGKQRWSFPTGGPVLAAPCLSGELVLVGSADKSFYALGRTDGKRRWSYATGDEIITAAALDTNLSVFFGSRDNQIYSLDSRTGKLRWKFPTRSRLSSDAVVAENFVYIGGEDHRIYALTCDDGALAFKHKVEGWVSTPAVFNRTVYFGCTDKGLYAIR